METNNNILYFNDKIMHKFYLSSDALTPVFTLGTKISPFSALENGYLLQHFPPIFLLGEK